MQLARVIGTVVATVKNDSLSGRTLLVVQTVDKNLQLTGKPMVAVDSVGAGVGELVFWCRGKEASFPFKREDTRQTVPLWELWILNFTSPVKRNDSCKSDWKHRCHSEEPPLRECSCHVVPADKSRR